MAKVNSAKVVTHARRGIKDLSPKNNGDSLKNGNSIDNLKVSDVINKGNFSVVLNIK